MRAGPSSREGNQNYAWDNTNPGGGLNNGIIELDDVGETDPVVDEWYKSIYYNASYADGCQEEASAQGNLATDGQRYYYGGGLNIGDIEPDYLTTALDLDGEEWLQETFTSPLAHRQVDAATKQYTLGAYNSQINYPQQLQPAPQTPLHLVQYSQPNHQFVEIPCLTEKPNGKARVWKAPPTSTPYPRVRRPPPEPTPKRRSGRSVPPAPKDSRWTIWTLGNLDIRYASGGVTVKHLQQVLFNTDGGKRSKHGHDSLMNQIIQKRNALSQSMPEGWNPTQGWWVHINPGPQQENGTDQSISISNQVGINQYLPQKR